MPAIIKIKAILVNPLAFQESLLKLSLGPKVPLPNKASAMEDRIAAFWLQRLIPPLPNNNKKPKMREQRPSINKISVGEKLESEKTIKLMP